MIPLTFALSSFCSFASSAPSTAFTRAENCSSRSVASAILNPSAEFQSRRSTSNPLHAVQHLTRQPLADVLLRRSIRDGHACGSQDGSLHRSCSRVCVRPPPVPSVAPVIVAGRKSGLPSANPAIGTPVMLALYWSNGSSFRRSNSAPSVAFTSDPRAPVRSMVSGRSGDALVAADVLHRSRWRRRSRRSAPCPRPPRRRCS